MSAARTECRLLLDPPADGAWNMAVDEVLLEEVGNTGQPVLRFYQWDVPTLSLGYFQNIADRAKHSASASAASVRRLSGGGAIMHDHELTYSFLLPATHPLARDTQQLYDCLHEAILSELQTRLLGSTTDWQPALCEESSDLSASEQPFLCFLRRSKGDILLRKTECENVIDHKIVGSAQRRRRGTVLQHGSIILNQSEAAPEILGINEIVQQNILALDLRTHLLSKIAESAHLSLLEDKLTDPLVAKVRQLQQAKYESADWTDRR